MQKGMPKGGRARAIYIDIELDNRLKEHAERADRSASYIIRKALHAYLITQQNEQVSVTRA